MKKRFKKETKIRCYKWKNISQWQIEECEIEFSDR